MTTYVSTDYDGCPYITPGKRYEVVFMSGGYFNIIDDVGDDIGCTVGMCNHLDGDVWKIHHVSPDETHDTPAPEYTSQDALKDIHKALACAVESMLENNNHTGAIECAKQMITVEELMK